ncbi:uncharacterized protein LOC108595754 [Drosophila busckii]|uniref:uncharacterized protein LOC108595754 n=1 Tax=Drosophila busckii TaxID=30019 RepID=UPI00083EDC59|nr:uncharacterized protein LOC108595754 [Drosophila busckii]
MVRLLSWCLISSMLVIEYNVILLAVNFVLMLVLIGHVDVKQHTMDNSKMYLSSLGINDLTCVLRGFCLCCCMLNAVLGIFAAKYPSILKCASYVLCCLILLFYAACIAGSRFHDEANYRYQTAMLLQNLWSLSRTDDIEELLDCCGKNGVIDYRLTNRTWSKTACCELPDCTGCEEKFYKYLYKFEQEIARDNIILFVLLLVGMLIMIFYYKDVKVMGDPYESESSSSDADEPTG